MIVFSHHLPQPPLQRIPISSHFVVVDLSNIAGSTQSSHNRVLHPPSTRNFFVWLYSQSPLSSQNTTFPSPHLVVYFFPHCNSSALSHKNAKKTFFVFRHSRAPLNAIPMSPLCGCHLLYQWADTNQDLGEKSFPGSVLTP